MINACLSTTRWGRTNWWCNRAFAIWICVVLAFVVRIGTSLTLRTYQFDTADDHWAFGYEWGRIARWLVETHMFSLDGTSPTSATDPLYIFIIAFFFHLFGAYSTNAAVALILFQSVLYSLCTWAIFVLAEKIYGTQEARLSALGFAVYPAAIFFAVGRIDPSGLSVLLLCLIFLTCCAFQDSKKLIFVCLGGALTGLLILTSSKCLILFILIPLWLFWRDKKHPIRALLPGLLFVALAVIVLVPWSIRNAAILGEFSITKGNLGYHVWAGNNPHATGYDDRIPPEYNPIADQIGWTDKLPIEILQEGHSVAYLGVALSWVKDHPQDFVLLTLKRIKYFWYQIPRSTISKGQLLQTWVGLIVALLAVVGALWSRGSIDRTGLLLLFIGCFPIVFYLTHVVYYRHRFHIEPFLLIVASHGCICLLAMIRRSNFSLQNTKGSIPSPTLEP